MTKDAAEFLVQHLVDPSDWVSDHDRAVCNVCTRAFGTFRRKHHCRMCGEVVCSGCTLHKNAHLPTIGFTRVRVCVSCIFNSGNSSTSNHALGSGSKGRSRTRKALAVTPGGGDADDSYSPRRTSPTTNSSGDDSHRWLSNHLHSPLSNVDHDFDPSDSMSSDEYDNQQGHRATYADDRSNQATNNAPGHPHSHAQLPSHHHHPHHPHHHQHQQWTHPWPQPPVPYDDIDRLEALHALQILDTAPEKAFDMICDLAKARLACPMAAVSFMDEHRQWFKASAGLAHKMIPRKIAFCAYTIALREPLVVLDALKDKRFDCNPLVSGAAAVRFYAAAPIIDPYTGHAIGSVFVLDTRPRESCDVEILERLAMAAAENLPRVEVDSPELRELDARMKQLREEQRSSGIHPTRTERAASQSRQQHHLGPAPVAPLPPSHGGTMPISPSSSSSSSSSVSTDVLTAPSSGKLSTALTASTTSNGESMEVLLMRLLTQNTETQQQLASQQLSLNSTLNQHSAQLSKLMNDVARMEAKIESRSKTTGAKQH